MSWKILITDGFEESGINSLIQNGFEVESLTLNPQQLLEILPGYNGIIVRSATKVRTDLIEKCSQLKFIARAGVGMDNIDVDFAKSKSIAVLNTPSSSSRSVAELAMAHMFSLTRGLQQSNRNLKDQATFKSLKKSLSSSNELQGKTLLLVGMGRIGRELAKMALGIGMKVIASDPFIKTASVEFKIQDKIIEIDIPLFSLDEALSQADYISLHSPYTGQELIGASNLHLLKASAFIINTSRGNNINEEVLLDALNSGKIAGAGLDVFHNEPEVNPALLNHPLVSVTPHIGASTNEAQLRIAEELVQQITELYQSEN